MDTDHAATILTRQRRQQASAANRARLTRWSAWAASAVAAWLAWLLLYKVTAGAGLVFAGPTATFGRLGQLVADGTLAHDLKITGLEFAISLAMSVVIGILAGIVVGYFRPIGMVLEPWLAAGYSTPLIALTPLFIIWFGLGIWSKVAVGFIVMVFPVLINTALGVSSADPKLIDVMKSMSATRWQIIWKVIIRGSFPHIAAGLRLAIGRGGTAVVAAELLGASAGMGYQLLIASQTFDVPLILAYVLVLAVLGAAMMMGVQALSSYVEQRRT
jgi:NitT/TauT family transport system permease protein